jgi:hypothetical protein
MAVSDAISLEVLPVKLKQQPVSCQEEHHGL